MAVEKQWLAQWRAAGNALRQQKADELANLSEAKVRQATGSLLVLAGRVRPEHPRWDTSGLLEQQRWFHRLPPP
ncbi:MAG TPA: hypothetical protein PLD25_07575 [Chloroflexota bacterium]|nr:hypothetical protein [Chloroflexota bacterium]HUM67764.1 hypothetical protein [Chloroflexota bacterium]